MRDRFRDDAGFSVSEMVIVTILLSMIIGASWFLMNSVTNMADQVEAKTIAADEGRAIMDQVTRELRQAYEIEDNQGAFVDAQPRQCTFYTDTNRDGVPEMVRYRVFQKTLFRSQATATSALPPYTFGSFGAEVPIVTSLDGAWTGNVFTYYAPNEDYDPSDPVNDDAFLEVTPGKPEDVSAVSIRLVTGATVNKKTAYVDLSTWVKVRAVHNTID